MRSRCGDGPVARKEPSECRESPLRGWGEDAGAEHLGDINPAVRVLEGTHPHSLADFRDTIPGDKQLGEVVRAVGWGGQQRQEGEVLDHADAAALGPGGLHH